MLTVPLVLAAASAGLIGGLHCIGMCGALSVMLSKPHARSIIPIHVEKKSKSASDIWYLFQLHAGRIFTYMVIGAIFGAIGAASYGLKTFQSFHQIWFVVGNASLILLGLHLIGLPWAKLIPSLLLKPLHTVHTQLSKLTPSTAQFKKYPFIVGLTWGALPCGLLFAIAPFAIFSGAAWSGAVLMLIFGLTALPHLLLSYGMLTVIKSNPYMFVFRMLIASALISIGLIGFWFANMKNMPDFLCIIPQ